MTDAEHRELIELQRAEISRLQAKIIRQKAEIAKYNAELKEITEKFNCQQIVYADLSDIIRDKNAEIERLREEKAKFDNAILYDLEQVNKIVKEAVSEAIKEFAERLRSEKTTAISCDLFEEVIRKSDIDNLVKEKAGDAE